MENIPTIRRLKKKDIPFAVELTKTGRLNANRQSEIKTWLKVDPDGMFVAVSESGEIIGVCGGIRFSDAQGLFGLHTVKEQYRRRGIGTLLWKAAANHLGDRNIAICGEDTSSFLDFTAREGFKVTAKWTLGYYEYSEPKLHRELQIPETPSISSCLVKSQCLLTKVLEYDQKIHHCDRELIVSSVLEEKARLTRAAIVDNQVVGYLCTNPTVLVNQLLIAPFYADSFEIAYVLMRDVIADLDFSSYPKGAFLLSFSNNPNVNRLIELFGFKNLGLKAVVRYTKFPVNVSESKIYSFNSFSYSCE